LGNGGTEGKGWKRAIARLLPGPVESYMRRTVREWRGSAERRHFVASALRHRFPSGLEVRVESRAEWLIFNDIFVERNYDAPIKAALRAANGTGPLQVLDLGANVGYFTVRVLDEAARQHPEGLPIEVHLVEASRSLCEELARRLGRPSRPEVRLQIVHGLVGKREGEGALYESYYHIGNSLTPDPGAARSIVPYVDLTAVKPGGGPIHLLKCDIEGAEEEFLASYPELLDRVAVGVIELHHLHCDTKRCIRLLEECGFVLHSLQDTPWFHELWFDRGQAAPGGTVRG